MEQNNSNIPIVKVGDTIYERYGSSDSFLLYKRKVERITKTQIILDRGTKLKNNPLKMWRSEEAYYLDAVDRNVWSNTNYYLETKELITQYRHEQLLQFNIIKKLSELILKTEKLQVQDIKAELIKKKSKSNK